MFGCSDDCRWMRHCEGMPTNVSADPISQPRFIGNRPSARPFGRPPFAERRKISGGATQTGREKLEPAMSYRRSGRAARGQALRSSSGSLAMFTAMPRASSREQGGTACCGSRGEILGVAAALAGASCATAIQMRHPGASTRRDVIIRLVGLFLCLLRLRKAR
jgi:hypothetical protein